MENEKVKKIGKAVGVAAVLAGLQALAPYADELIAIAVGTLPAPIVPIVVTLIGYVLRFPFQSTKK